MTQLKKIDENPDPTKLRSNRLGYELEYGEAIYQSEPGSVDGRTVRRLE
jgi:hypothetical protein